MSEVIKNLTLPGDSRLLWIESPAFSQLHIDMLSGDKGKPSDEMFRLFHARWSRISRFDNEVQLIATSDGTKIGEGDVIVYNCRPFYFSNSVEVSTFILNPKSCSLEPTGECGLVELQKKDLNENETLWYFNVDVRSAMPKYYINLSVPVLLKKRIQSTFEYSGVDFVLEEFGQDLVDTILPYVLVVYTKKGEYLSPDSRGLSYFLEHAKDDRYQDKVYLLERNDGGRWRALSEDERKKVTSTGNSKIINQIKGKLFRSPHVKVINRELDER